MPLQNPISQRIVDVAQTLIGFESVLGNARGLDGCLHWVSEYLSKIDGVQLKQYRHEGVASVVASFRETLEPDLLLLGHLDVVSSAPEQFKPTVRGDALHGRGAIDMKGPAAALLMLMSQISTLKTRPNVALALTFDEEQGGFHGAGHLAELGYRPKLVIAPDGGMGERWSIIHSEKGVAMYRIKALGKAAHSAYGWEGENAVVKLFQAYDQFSRDFPKPDPARDYWHSTVNVSCLRGGTAPNVVPAEAELTLDFRLTEQREIAWVDELVHRRFATCEIELLVTVLPSRTDPTHPAVLKLAELIAREIGEPPQIRASHGSTDCKHFASFGIPTLVLQAIGGDIHGPNEWVSLASLQQLYAILRDFVLER